MTKFYIVRHGQSLGHANKTFLGHTDWDLSELGYAQAQKTAEFLADKGIEAIYTSDLMRAFNTALPVCKKYGIEPFKDTRLREIYAGEWEGLVIDDILSNYPNYQIWRNDIGNVTCDGGESTKELQQRANEVFTEIAEANDGKTVCVATHATVIRVMTCIWLDMPLTEAKNLKWVSNASVSEIDYADGKWIPVYIGNDQHLQNLVSTLPPNV